MQLHKSYSHQGMTDCLYVSMSIMYVSISINFLLACRRQMDAIRRLSQPTTSSPFESLLRMVRCCACIFCCPAEAKGMRAGQHWCRRFLGVVKAACAHVACLEQQKHCFALAS